MKKTLVVLLLLISIIVDAQSRKKQIERLKYKIDSLNLLLFEERNTNSIKIQELISVNNKYGSQIIDLNNQKDQIISKFNGEIALLKDSVNNYKNELSIINSFNVWNGSSYERSEFGNLIILFKYEIKFIDGDSNPYYNGDYWHDILCIYFLREADKVKQVKLEECFNFKKKELLDEINRKAKQQFEEDYEIVNDCGGVLKQHFYFKDLEMHFNDSDICFEYDVGVWKGSNCGGPRDQVCFEKDYILKYLN
jgi:hypothetical protein